MTQHSIRHKGSWWLLPGFLEYPPGPWNNGVSTGRLDIVDGWRRAIDWMHDHGLNVLIAGIPPEEKAEVRQDWGYHYVCEFERYPEARVFSSSFTQRNRDILAAITTYAAEKHVAPFIHHYNFLAPAPLIYAHPELTNQQHLLLNAKLQRGYQDWTGLLMGNVCWHNQTYRNFLKACMHELLTACPDLAGIMVTAGECASCPCPRCTKTVVDETGHSNNDKMRADFLFSFRDWLKSWNRRGLVRAWQVEKALQLFPKDGLTYILKQTVFDCLDAGPDPVVDLWLDNGFDIWVSKEIYGENAGPLIWFDPAYFHRQVHDALDSGVSGALSFHNTQRSIRGLQMPVEQLNYRAYVQYLAHPEETFDRAVWVTEFKKLFGDAGGEILTCMEKAAKPVLSVSRVYFTSNEGHTFDFFHNLCLKNQLHTIGTSKTEPPEWARGAVEPLTHYARWIAENGWKEQLLDQPIHPDGLNPLTFMRNAAVQAMEGALALDRILGTFAGNNRNDLELARLSAHACWQFGLEWVHFCRAFLFYRGALAQNAENTRKEFAQRCVDELSESATAIRRQMERLLSYPAHIVDPYPLFQAGGAVPLRYTASIRERWEYKLREITAVKDQFGLELTQEEIGQRALAPHIDHAQQLIFSSALRQPPR